MPNTRSRKPKGRLLPRKAVEDRIGKSRSWIYSAMKKGEFPLPFETSAGSVAWDESEIDGWAAARPRRSYEGSVPRRRSRP